MTHLIEVKPREWYTGKKFWSLAWLMRLINSRREPCDNIESLLSGEYDETCDKLDDETSTSNNEYGTAVDPDYWPEGVDDNQGEASN